MTSSRRLWAFGFVLATLIGSGCAHTPHSSCAQIGEIRSIPMKGQGSDEAYLSLIEAGEAAIPCLIDNISNTKPMRDPRMAPQYQGTVVGDVAVFMLVRISGNEFSSFLPENVKKSYSEKGVYAYFDYVADLDHRKELQERWREWWQLNIE